MDDSAAAQDYRSAIQIPASSHHAVFGHRRDSAGTTPWRNQMHTFSLSTGNDGEVLSLLGIQIQEQSQMELEKLLRHIEEVRQLAAKDRQWMALFNSDLERLLGHTFAQRAMGRPRNFYINARHVSDVRSHPRREDLVFNLPKGCTEEDKRILAALITDSAENIWEQAVANAGLEIPEESPESFQSTTHYIAPPQYRQTH